MSSTSDTCAAEPAALALALNIFREAPGIRVVPEHAAKETPGHRVKLELCQFDRFTKGLFHYVTPFSGYEQSAVGHSLQQQPAIPNFMNEHPFC
jgi:hypothetical protein